jgi:hypothetical protein
MEIMRLFIYIPRRFKSITYVILYIMCTIIISLNNNIINLRKKKGREEGEKVVRQNYFSLSVCLFVGCLTFIFINYSRRRRRSLHKIFLRSHPVRVSFIRFCTTLLLLWLLLLLIGVYDCAYVLYYYHYYLFINNNSYICYHDVINYYIYTN